MMETFPLFPSRPTTPLDGVWDFSFQAAMDSSRPEWENIVFDSYQAVPGVFDALPEHPGLRGVGFYRRRFHCAPGARMRLKLEGIGLAGTVFIDRNPAGSIRTPYCPRELEFSVAEGGEHELTIAIDNRIDFKRFPLFSLFYDYYGHGGIYRSVELSELPEQAWDRIRIFTASGSAKITLKAALRSGFSGSLKVAFHFDGEAECEEEIVFTDGTAEFEATIADSGEWSPEHPLLHTFSARLPGGDTIVERFGIRTVEAKHGKIHLNGTPLKLKGYCRHEAHPEFGPALPDQILIEDMQQLKLLGCNFVRGSHYPQDPRFLELCDLCGMLVWEEGIGWGDQPDHLTDRNFQEAQLEQIAPMVKRSFNHPCVIIRGFLNEGASNAESGRELYTAMARELRRCDPTRPITYATMHGESDLFFDLVDIISTNIYPGWYNSDREAFRPLEAINPRLDQFLDFMKTHGLEEKPYIISEIGAGAIYGWRDRFHAHWSEEYQADLLDVVCERFMKDERICGLALWQFMDCRTYASSYALMRPRAFNNKGTFDEYRRPKLAAEVVKKHFSR